MSEPGNESVTPHERLDGSRCPECGSDDGYWQNGVVADFDYVCEDCGGVFDGTTAERRAKKA